MTRLAVLLDAQARLDDGTATDADRKAVAELDARLQPSVERILAITTLADLDAQHDAICDTRDKTCHHYQPMEG